MKKIEYFLNDRMKLLIVLNKHQIELNDVFYSPISQDEIAAEIGCSKVKANQLIKDLIDNGYVKVMKKGKYILTESAIRIIEKLELGE